MVVFFQLTILEMGGDRNLLKKKGAQVTVKQVYESKLMRIFQIALGSPPLCCLAPFSCTKLKLTPGLLRLVRVLILQMPMNQFAVLYILMSFKLSEILSSTLGTAITILSTTISWLGGIWGMGMLKNVIGKSLESTEFVTRQTFVQTMATLIEFQHLLIIKVQRKVLRIIICTACSLSDSWSCQCLSLLF